MFIVISPTFARRRVRGTAFQRGLAARQEVLAPVSHRRRRHPEPARQTVERLPAQQAQERVRLPPRREPPRLPPAVRVGRRRRALPQTLLGRYVSCRTTNIVRDIIQSNETVYDAKKGLEDICPPS